MVVSHSGIDNGIYVCIYIGIYIGICIYIGIDNDKVIIGINVRRGGGIVVKDVEIIKNL